jgi:hypothetical protein
MQIMIPCPLITQPQPRSQAARTMACVMALTYLLFHYVLTRSIERLVSGTASLPLHGDH